MMMSLALPERRLLRVDLYPRVTVHEMSVSVAHIDAVAGCRWAARTLSRLHHKRELGVDGVGILLALLDGHLDCFRGGEARSRCQGYWLVVVVEVHKKFVSLD